ncbi:DUF7527 domain-containing protein [Natrarchaeobaculum sulfurireducens]|uniref:DUF7527 domain-containing protein n=1 Tax=Natrarchaeobaculum sulfurireducens TaxID=2044521 RepID=A0A346PQD9_9EURY|nr:transcriptional regulator [Natrarchaeobaculum sulfurireducens]AXR81734.1 hypothetical protein AArcMg_1724 [Natrarchaeobaculum sulfurireducens]
MEPRTKKRVEQWDSRPFSGGYAALSDLAASGFSGAVSVSRTWLFMLNGRVVGVFDGDIEDFENASGTIYEAPHPSLPLLCSMEERGGDTRAKYYTNETPLEEVDKTLRDGSFTGYVELSENVLSGDYYAVYYGGRRMAAAYIGNAERLLTGDDAFDRAAEEVGIYQVIDVEVEVTDVPETDDDTETGGDTGDDDGSVDAQSGTNTPTTAANSSSSNRPEPSADPTESAIEPIDISGGNTGTDGVSSTSGITADDSVTTEPEPAGITTADSTQGDSLESTSAEVTDDTSAEPADGISAGPVNDTSAEPAHDTSTEPTHDTADDSSGSALEPEEVEAAAAELEQNDISWTEESVDGVDAAESTADAVASTIDTDNTSDSADDTSGGSDSADDEAESELEERFEEEEQWRETRSIPSIDPDKTSNADSRPSKEATKPRQKASRSGEGRSAVASESRSADATGTSTATQRQQTRSRSANRSTDGSQASASAQSESRAEHPIERLKARVERLESRREELVSKAERLESERDRLQSENQELTERVERLQSHIADLETELEQARDDETTVAASRQLSAAQARSGTNLFVRYGSKSEPTLRTAHEGDADRDDVAANLRLEQHTEFDAADVAVDGQSYEEFLTGTMAYQFVDWLTEVLLYEIRDTGHASGLADLYDAIPRIDRAELQGSISLADDDTEDVPDQVSFDVVAYDKMGNPLVVVTVNDSREPASEELLAGLEEAASAVKANYPDLAAAIAVTSSYFEPGALEVTEQATTGGFLSRSSKSSFVNVSRKQGYHLCLVESQSDGFHMSVPEL